MYEELIEQLDAAVRQRNPGLGLQPGLVGDVVRKELKKVGITKNVEGVVAMYSWRNGTKTAGEPADRLGIAPPEVKAFPTGHVEMLKAMGVKVDANQKVYESFAFNSLDFLIWNVKHWKKFCGTLPELLQLAGRYVPVIWQKAKAMELAVEVETGRVVMVTAQRKPQVREAYGDFAEFLRDLIRANETDTLLSCVEKPGASVELSDDEWSRLKAEVAAARAAKRKGKVMIPVGEKPFVVRADFSNEVEWGTLCAMLKPGNELTPEMDLISDRAFEGVTAKKLRGLVVEESGASFGMIADGRTFSDADRPVLVVDLLEEPGRSFRAAARAVGEVAANLSVGNMGFEEFAEAARRGVYRGMD